MTEPVSAEKGNDFIAEALRSSEPSLIQNLKVRAGSVQHDYAVAIALPLHSEGISGVLTIYSKDANAFDVAEVELLKELAETLSHGLMTLRARNQLKQTNKQLHREISDRKQAEAALQESYHLLRNVINASSDPIFVKDRQGYYTLINTSCASLFNKSVEEILGHDSSVLLPPEICAQHQASDKRIITSGQSEILEATFVIQGKAKAYLITKNVYSDPAGNIMPCCDGLNTTATCEIWERLSCSSIQGRQINPLADLLWNEVEISEHKGSLIVRSGKGAKCPTIPLNKDA